jgi:hypothetical protein
MGSPLPPDLSWIVPSRKYQILVRDSACNRDWSFDDDYDITVTWYQQTGQFILDWYAGGFDSVCGGPYPSPGYPHFRQIILEIKE